jgi:hypothetical protein
MRYVECPNKTDDNKPSLFLAGGLSGCRNWQKTIIPNLYPLDIILYNPRRASFDHSDPNIAEEQIKWEEESIRKSDVISFYFCRETLCPITLFELGTCLMTSKPIIIGMDPDYSRRQDVEIQVKLKRPDVQIVYGVKNLTDSIIDLLVNKLNVTYGNSVYS